MDADKLDRRTVSPLWEADEQYIDILLGPERTRECFFLEVTTNRKLQVKPQRGCEPLLVWCLRLVFWLCVV